MKKEKKIKQLKKLQNLANQLESVIDSFVEQALEITEEKDEAGYTWDFILNNFGTAEELVERFKNDKTSSVK